MFESKHIKQINQRLNKVTTALINNSISTLHIRDQLSGLLGESHGGKRSIYDVYGYDERYTFERGYKYARREGISNRVVFGVPASCWRNGFEIKSSEDEDAETLLEKEIKMLNEKELFSKLERADSLNRIGKFSALFVGVPDGLELDQPVGRAAGNALESIYFRPYAYDGITVAKYVDDETDERYGLPELYQLQVMGRGDTEKTTNVKSIKVHWTRVIHMAETRFDSDIEGLPALEPIFNRIIDIDKATGGAAEAYFRNARGKIAFQIDPEFSTELLDNPAAKEAFDEAGKKFTNDWEDQITAVGSTVSPITTSHQSPMDTVKVALWAISGNTGIPIRVLTGEGAGQLAGSEDRLAYNSLIKDRNDHVCSVWVKRLLAILEQAGMITLPDGYCIEFPMDEPLTEIDMAELQNKRADTLTKLTSAASSMGGDSIKLESVLENFGFEDIEIEELPDLPDVDPFAGPAADAGAEEIPPADDQDDPNA